VLIQSLMHLSEPPRDMYSKTKESLLASKNSYLVVIRNNFILFAIHLSFSDFKGNKLAKSLEEESKEGL